MDLVDLYYSINVGEIPENINEYKRTKLLFDYLLESGLDEGKIITTMITKFPNKNCLTINDLPDSLWNESLIIRNKFYYHKELQILSPPPSWEETTPFYLEMKIKYTSEDILKYFIKRFNIREEWINKEKEIGSINFLLTAYKKYSFIEPVDYILHLIDYVAALSIKVNTIYDLRTYENELAEYLECDIENAKSSHKNKVIWRTDVLCGI